MKKTKEATAQTKYTSEVNRIIHEAKDIVNCATKGEMQTFWAKMFNELKNAELKGKSKNKEISVFTIKKAVSTIRKNI